MTSRSIGTIQMPVETAASIGPEILPGLPLSPGIIEIMSSEKEEAKSGNLLNPPNPFEPGELSTFVQWLQRKSPLSSTGLPRYMDAVYNERADLQKTMPEVRMGELSAFAWWAHIFGRFEVPSFRLFGHKVSIRRSIAPGGRVSGGVDAIGFFKAEHGIGEAARLLVEAIRTTDVPVSTVGYWITESRQRA
jgi:hypothetical protein